MLKQLKKAALKSLRAAGVSTLVHNSRWRRERLLILAYHGISLVDEHEWNCTQYMPVEILQTRLQQLIDSRCVVLPLDEAVTRLYEGDLPDRAVTITFDDGTADFRFRAYPLIKEFNLPVTLYLTTFYSQYNRPVFDPIVSYLLWKGRNKSLNLSKLISHDVHFDLRSDEAQNAARVAVLEFARQQKLSAEEKDQLAARLAQALDIDYQMLCEQRIMRNLTPDEVTELAANGVDIQLHTHRHRVPKDHDLFIREIDDNRANIQTMTRNYASHFCYPSGVTNPMFLPWLTEAGVLSATTCEPGFASVNANRLLLPRVLDNSALSPIEFESWLTGISAALPRRRVAPASDLGTVHYRT